MNFMRLCLKRFLWPVRFVFVFVLIISQLFDSFPFGKTKLKNQNKKPIDVMMSIFGKSNRYVVPDPHIIIF